MTQRVSSRQLEEEVYSTSGKHITGMEPDLYGA